MNFAAFERAQLAAFAYREARRTGALDCMRAVCYVIRNRVKSAWGDGTWLSVMAGSHLCASGFEPFVMGEITPNAMPATASDPAGAPAMISGFRSDDRLLQLIVRDVDDIYLGQENFEDRVRQVCCMIEGGREALGNKDWKPVLYYSFVDRDPRPWFVEHIIRLPKEHPCVGQLGPMMLYR